MTDLLDRIAIGAPSQLVADTRVEFRAAALDCLDRAAEQGSEMLEIDMSATENVDASGLGTLVVLQKRARDRGLATRLRGTRQPVRSLLATTRLEGLFQFS
jgi:anti-anti-sigma regulatory factor